MYDINWNITHTAPNGEEAVNVSMLVDKLLPYAITIIPYETVSVSDDVICFNYVEPNDPNDSINIDVIHLESFHFYVPPNNCIYEIHLYVDGKLIATGFETGLNTYAIPTEFDYSFSLEAYATDGSTLQVFNNTDHSPENVYYFATNCN